MIEIPIRTIDQMREEYGQDSEETRLLNYIVNGLVTNMWKDGVFQVMDLGLERTIEVVEHLIDKGQLKLCTDPEKEVFFLKFYNEDTDEYQQKGNFN
jgi:hypothetical protein